MKRLLVAMFLLTGCGQVNHVSETKDVIGEDEFCRKVKDGDWYYGKMALKYFRGFWADCGGDEIVFVVERRTDPYNSIVRKDQVLRLQLRNGFLSFNGINVGEDPSKNSWDELCSGRFKDICDIHVNPVKIVLKGQNPPQP